MYIHTQQVLQKKMREKWDQEGEKFGCNRVRRRTQLTSQGCYEAEVAFRDTPGWGEVPGTLFAGIDEFLDVLCPKKEMCIGEGTFQQGLLLGRPAGNLPSN